MLAPLGFQLCLQKKNQMSGGVRAGRDEPGGTSEEQRVGTRLLKTDWEEFSEVPGMDSRAEMVRWGTGAGGGLYSVSYLIHIFFVDGGTGLQPG